MKFSTIISERPREVLQGPAAVGAASQERERRAAKSEWPYKWVYPPPGAIPVRAGLDTSGTLAVPTVAAGLTQVLSYTVDLGFRFALTRLVFQLLSSGVYGPINPGSFTWSLTVNQPVGITDFQGNYLQGLTNVDVPLGSLQIPWLLDDPEIFAPGDVVRAVVTNVTVPDGSPNFFKAIFLGWKWAD